MLNALKKILKFTLIFVTKCDTLIRSFKWKYLRPKNRSSEEIKVHFLLVKDAKYVPVLRICLNSFLYWHPNAKIAIHVDSITIEQVTKKILGKRGCSNIEIKMDMDCPDCSWQILKLRLLTSLNGTSDIYLDADMRWNGKLPARKTITFLTTEFELKGLTIYLLLLNQLRNSRYMNAKMRNTSFFTFAGYRVAEESIQDVQILHNEIVEIIQSGNFGVKDKPNLLRIAEQIALSIASEDWSLQISHLKDLDGWKDGAFVESSYFGSTGVSF